MGIYKSPCFGKLPPLIGFHREERDASLVLNPQSTSIANHGHSPASVNRIWGIWGSYCNIPKAIFYLLQGTISGTPIPSPLHSSLSVV